MIPGLLMSLLAASLSAPPEEMGAPAPLLPWAVTDRAFEQARYLELEGKPRVAAATVAGTCDGAVSPEAAYLGGVLYEGAGETALALRCLRQVAAADHPLRPRAAWHLHVLETPAEGKTSPADPWLALASSPGLAGRVALARARSLEAAGSRRAAAALLTRALAGPLLPSEALETRLLLARCLTGHGERARGRELLARLAWEGSAEAAEALREEEPLAALDVQDHRRWVGLTPEEAAGRRAGGDPGGWTPEQRLREGVALLGSRERREDALAHLLSARDAAEGNLRIAATWHAAVALEKLDRDLEALALLEELRDLPGLPFATELRVRMGRLCLREALPDRGREVLEEALADASPGTDLSEAVWSLARYHRTAGEPRRCLDLLRLLRRGFTIQRSPWETWGPLALYWEARTLDGLGRREAAIRLWELLWAAAPMNFYGVLSRARLEDASHAPAPPGPATWNAPPLEIGPLGSLDREVLALPLALWRLGRYGEAREETRALLASGRLTPALPALHASLQLRGDGLRSAASLRRSMGTLLPPPWRGGARLWIGSLPVRFLDLLAPVAAGDGGGMDPSIIAALIRFESSWNTGAVSHADAHGLMQLRPYVAEEVAERCMGRRVGRRDLRDPALNLRIGAQFLREVLHRHHGNWLVTLAAFNAGTGTASSWLKRFQGLEADEWLEQLTYPNTVGYVKRILGAAEGYRSLYWPALGTTSDLGGIAWEIPPAPNPFLDEPGARCAPGARDGEAP